MIIVQVYCLSQNPFLLLRKPKLKIPPQGGIFSHTLYLCYLFIIQEIFENKYQESEQQKERRALARRSFLGVT